MSRSRLPVGQLGQITPKQEEEELLWRLKNSNPAHATPQMFIKSVESNNEWMESKRKQKWSKRFDDDRVMVVVFNRACQKADGREYHVEYYDL